MSTTTTSSPLRTTSGTHPAPSHSRLVSTHLDITATHDEADLAAAQAAPALAPHAVTAASAAERIIASTGMSISKRDLSRGTWAKRALDLFGSICGLIALAPVLAVIALIVKLDSRGPVFFRQTRVGLNGTEFSIIKFRTMSVGAEKQVDSLMALNEGAGPLFKIKEDPRITRVGGVLRRLSLDELPQLFNVLGGSMSLVGPRPGLPREVEQYEPHAHGRLLVSPGITGLWQVSGRSDLEWSEGLRLDLHYVENRSLALDIKLLARTVPMVLGSRGAY
ncbi:exopolysaccharide biosynthesis polyprenyl glycosylphosphotransferase [Mycetocola sp. BIGb0189]|uniref:sugar transferase n=1 Tax=Mycetocola sp. BIGb0189 TaxID=2940604 RepID=UPI00216A8DAB|nr:exopolysaccharide biosynthesis polyprenyl glycosylphosphotransferase [Mycetocola sp. BIGb0189]MCS4275664.1 exopolysaccharide biosynthesis polyprenyl glycosylphosphotransferase [Mycetocola sp. BIGb0189]